MTLPVYPNLISLGNVNTEYGLSATALIGLGSYYAKSGGPVYPGSVGLLAGVSTAIPTSGTISLGNFSGHTAYIPSAKTVSISASGSSTWTVPSTVSGNLTIKAFGGGGGGSMWPSGAPGGAGGGGAQFIGSIAAGTVISYTVATGGPGFRGDSTRYARDPGNTQFGVSGNPYYMYIPGLGVGAYNMSGSQRGPGVGSTAQGTAGVTLGTGGNGGNEGSGTGGSGITIGAGGGGAAPSGGGGAGVSGGGAGGAVGQAGIWPGGGGHGQDGTGFAGATGGIIITGTW